MWKTMSRPMKSASASGPIGWLAPFCIAASMSAIDAEAALEARDRVDHVGHQQAVHDVAGRVARPRPAVLPSCFAKRDARRRPSRARCAAPGATSTSFMAWTGLKKCRPTKRSGRLVAAASSATVSVEVLVAKIAPSFTTSSSRPKCSRFTGSSSTIDSITRSTSARSWRCVRPAQALEERAVVGGGELAASRRPSGAASRPSPRWASSGARGGLRHDGLEAGARRGLRDAEAHLSRAEDADAANLHGALPLRSRCRRSVRHSSEPTSRGAGGVAGHRARRPVLDAAPWRTRPPVILPRAARRDRRGARESGRQPTERRQGHRRPPGPRRAAGLRGDRGARRPRRSPTYAAARRAAGRRRDRPTRWRRPSPPRSPAKLRGAASRRTATTSACADALLDEHARRAEVRGRRPRRRSTRRASARSAAR